MICQGPRLSRCGMIWLLPHPFPPSPLRKLDRRHTLRLRESDNLLTVTVGGGGWGGAKSYDTEPGPIRKSFEFNSGTNLGKVQM
jgi:hypothetical protein